MWHRAYFRTLLAAGTCISCLALVHPQWAHAKVYTALGGRLIDLPDKGTIVGSPALSADGALVGYVREAGDATDEDDPQPTEVVVINLVDRDTRILVHWDKRFRFAGPVIRVTFAANGHNLFAERAYQGDSHPVYEIDSVTGKERLLAWGIDIRVLRDGPWRGDLLMGVHTCYSTHTGCDYPVHVVTPDGKTIYIVPGTAGADRNEKLAVWLKKHRWRAW